MLLIMMLGVRAVRLGAIAYGIGLLLLELKLRTRKNKSTVGRAGFVAAVGSKATACIGRGKCGGLTRAATDLYRRVVVLLRLWWLLVLGGAERDILHAYSPTHTARSLGHWGESSRARRRVKVT